MIFHPLKMYVLTKKLFFSFQPFCFELFVAYLFFICHQSKNSVYFFSCLESTPSKQQQDFLRPRLVEDRTSPVFEAQTEPAELFKLSLTQARAFKVQLKQSQPSNFFPQHKVKSIIRDCKNYFLSFKHEGPFFQINSFI